ncbi:MAG: aminotransferase class IV [Dehalococcoidia bacterium]
MVEPILYIGGRFVPQGQAHLSPLDRGFSLADGLFETMVAVGDCVFRLDDHLSRLLEGARLLELPLPTPEEMAWAVRETLRRNGLPRSVARLTVTRGVDLGRGLALPAQCTPMVVVRVTPRQPLTSQTTGRSLIVASLRRNEFSPLSQAKSLAYTEGIVARLEAQRAGAEDALLLNTRGDMACATSSNLFLVRSDGTVVTPPPSDGALPGIARRTVLEMAPRLGLLPLEESIAPADLMRAEEIFLTNVVTGPVPVISIDGRPVGAGEPGRVSLALATSYVAVVEG